MRISVELVPRSPEALCEELGLIKAALSQVDTVNIPDILRFELRSWQGCAHARPFYTRVIPHIRAIDIDPKKPLPMAGFLQETGVDEVLVITGDAPADMSRTVYPTSSLDVIRKFRRELPEVRVYAALDPYRQSFKAERDYVLRKLEAGAAGLFTQPFFDLRLMAVYAELLSGTTVFWGITNVMSERSLAYWQTRNQAVFPRDFTPSLAWNRRFAEEALAFVRERDANVYFMPIRTDVLRYLGGILS